MIHGAQLSLPATDLDHILTRTTNLWEDLRGQQIFLTGGTGFVGTWLVESFLHANEQLDLNASLCVLSRNPSAFQQRSPWLGENPALKFCSGDVASFTFPHGEFSHLIHAATETDSAANPLDPVEHFDANVQGTRRMLEFARRCGCHRFLFTSSGAVYGRQPPDNTHLAEEYPGAPQPTDPASAYGHSKRISEFLCVSESGKGSTAFTIARLFAFVGPHLKLNANFAIGNFIRDALNGDTIRIQGDGTPFRSYLYAADLAIWLWTMLLRGKAGRVYNTGSDRVVSIAQLAQRVCDVIAPETEILVAQKPDPSRMPARYVPDIGRARSELGLDVRVGLDESIRRTAGWHLGFKL